MERSPWQLWQKVKQSLLLSSCSQKRPSQGSLELMHLISILMDPNLCELHNQNVFSV